MTSPLSEDANSKLTTLSINLTVVSRFDEEYVRLSSYKITETQIHENKILQAKSGLRTGLFHSVICSQHNGAVGFDWNVRCYSIKAHGS